MGNHTSDIITEDDGDFFKSRKRPYLSATSRFLHLSRHVRRFRTPFPFRQKGGERRGKSINNECALSYSTERFQDQGSQTPPGKCQRQELVQYGRIYCIDPFYVHMSYIGTENWCLLQNVIRYRQKYQHIFFSKVKKREK